jgi:type 1 glutamine amidotransferase
VKNGTGLAGWHGGIADSYRNTSDYLHLIGGQFACHPRKHPDECIGEQSDNYVPYTVNMLPPAAERPTTKGIRDFDLVTEQYWVLSDDYIDVLATTTQKVREWDPWNREVTSPAVWTRQWGKGRIFVATPGTGSKSSRTRTSARSLKGACCGQAVESRNRWLRRHHRAVPCKLPEAQMTSNSWRWRSWIRRGRRRWRSSTRASCRVR